MRRKSLLTINHTYLQQYLNLFKRTYKEAMIEEDRHLIREVQIESHILQKTVTCNISLAASLEHQAPTKEIVLLRRTLKVQATMRKKALSHTQEVFKNQQTLLNRKINLRNK